MLLFEVLQLHLQHRYLPFLLHQSQLQSLHFLLHVLNFRSLLLEIKLSLETLVPLAKLIILKDHPLYFMARLILLTVRLSELRGIFLALSHQWSLHDAGRVVFVKVHSNDFL